MYSRYITREPEDEYIDASTTNLVLYDQTTNIFILLLQDHNLQTFNTNISKYINYIFHELLFN